MSQSRDRVGQHIGPWLVVAKHRKTKHGKRLWRLIHEDGRVKHLPTYRVIRLDRKHQSNGL